MGICMFIHISTVLLQEETFWGTMQFLESQQVLLKGCPDVKTSGCECAESTVHSAVVWKAAQAAAA